MLETIGLPVLLKSVELLFGEGRKILQERRERRASEKGVQVTQESSLSPTAEASTDYEIRTKEAAMDQSVSEALWLDSEAKIRHLTSLLEIRTKTYYLAKEQYAKWGSALVPPIVVHTLAEAEDEIAKTTAELEVALSNVYGKKVAASGNEQA